jgi:hypothetical protein
MLWVMSRKLIPICSLGYLTEFENRLLRSVFGPKRDEVTGVEENCILRNFITCTLRQV